MAESGLAGQRRALGQRMLFYLLFKDGNINPAEQQ